MANDEQHLVMKAHGRDFARLAKEVADAELAVMPEPERESILQEAERLVGGERLKFYGPPHINFKRIADMWSAYLNTEVSPLDVCSMMILLKVARIRTGGSYHRDSAVDAAGYARLLEILSEAP